MPAESYKVKGKGWGHGVRSVENVPDKNVDFVIFGIFFHFEFNIDFKFSGNFKALHIYGP